MTFGIVQHLRSARAGARPGDGTVRSLLDGEIFINSADGVFCILAASGAMQTIPWLGATGLTSTLASLPTTQPDKPGVLWLSGGFPKFPASGIVNSMKTRTALASATVAALLSASGVGALRRYSSEPLVGKGLIEEAQKGLDLGRGQALRGV